MYNFSQFDKKILPVYSLSFPITDEIILLNMSSTGWNKGYYTGYSEKFDVSKGDKSVDDAALRGLSSSGFLTTKSGLEKKAIIDMFFQESHLNQSINVYLTKEWIGCPKFQDGYSHWWFNKEDVPFWQVFGAGVWLKPALLEGKNIKAEIYWKKDSSDNKYIVDLWGVNPVARLD